MAAAGKNGACWGVIFSRACDTYFLGIAIEVPKATSAPSGPLTARILPKLQLVICIRMAPFTILSEVFTAVLSRRYWRPPKLVAETGRGERLVRNPALRCQERGEQTACRESIVLI
jgi:hypothetical protein